MINFSIKSGKAVIGQNRLEMIRFRNVELVLLSDDISPNTEKNLIKRYEKEKILKLKDEIAVLESLTGRKGVKVIGFIASELQREIFRLIKTYEGTVR
ncbi:MAG: hypothetical protein R6V47_03795 [Candidatus Delongbacteria bacterium]